MHKSIKKALGCKPNISDKKLLSNLKKRTSQVCKPCWELKYCPYGPIVEFFPLLPPTRKSKIDHNNYLQECLKTNKLDSGEKVDEVRKKWLKNEVKKFNPEDYPESIPRILLEISCMVFGHICPVFFVSEPLTETKERRKHNRSIPRDVMLKVVRRDGQICQKCNEPVVDKEVEFDHIIPFSKGGESTMENLRLIHKNCNRRKSNSLEDLLHPNPIEHLFDWKKKKK